MRNVSVTYSAPIVCALVLLLSVNCGPTAQTQIVPQGKDALAKTIETKLDAPADAQPDAAEFVEEEPDVERPDVYRVDRAPRDEGEAVVRLLRIRQIYTGKDRRAIDATIRILIRDCGDLKQYSIDELFEPRYLQRGKYLMNRCAMFLSNGCHVCGKHFTNCKPSCHPGDSPDDPPWEEWWREETRFKRPPKK